jgi:hypothetical protein
MTPAQAIDLLYRAARMAHLPAADHDACREAAKVVASAIQPPPAAESTPANVETKPDPPDCSTP